MAARDFKGDGWRRVVGEPRRRRRSSREAAEKQPRSSREAAEKLGERSSRARRRRRRSVPELQIVRGRKSEPHSCLVRGRVKGTYGLRGPTAFVYHFSSRAPTFCFSNGTFLHSPTRTSSRRQRSICNSLFPPPPPLPPAPPLNSRRRRHAQQSSFFGNGIAATSHETLLEEQGRGQAFSPPQRPAVPARCSRRLCVARWSLSRRHVAPRRSPRTWERVDWPRD
jgi:hypothetical protein